MVRSVLMSMWAARCCSPPRPALPCPALPCPALGHSMHRALMLMAYGLWNVLCIICIMCYICAQGGGEGSVPHEA
jgi:hypothetical protein